MARPPQADQAGNTRDRADESSAASRPQTELPSCTHRWPRRIGAGSNGCRLARDGAGRIVRNSSSETGPGRGRPSDQLLVETACASISKLHQSARPDHDGEALNVTSEVQISKSRHVPTRRRPLDSFNRAAASTGETCEAI